MLISENLYQESIREHQSLVFFMRLYNNPHTYLVPLFENKNAGGKPPHYIGKYAKILELINFTISILISF